MNEKQTWIIIAAIHDIEYCLRPKTTHKQISSTLKLTLSALRNINAPEPGQLNKTKEG